MAGLVIEQSYLVGAGTTGHDDVLLVVELGCVDEGSGGLAGEGLGLTLFGWAAAATCSLCGLSITLLTLGQVDFFIIFLLVELVVLHLVFQIFTLSLVTL